MPEPHEPPHPCTCVQHDAFDLIVWTCHSTGAVWACMTLTDSEGAERYPTTRIEFGPFDSAELIRNVLLLRLERELTALLRHSAF